MREPSEHLEEKHIIRYKVVKIVRSCSEEVLQTIKHTMIYPSSDSSFEVIVICLTV
jgi:hypothetical protein